MHPRDNLSDSFSRHWITRMQWLDSAWGPDTLHKKTNGTWHWALDSVCFGETYSFFQFLNWLRVDLSDELDGECPCTLCKRLSLKLRKMILPSAYRWNQFWIWVYGILQQAAWYKPPMFKARKELKAQVNAAGREPDLALDMELHSWTNEQIVGEMPLVLFLSATRGGKKPGVHARECFHPFFFTRFRTHFPTTWWWALRWWCDMIVGLAYSDAVDMMLWMLSVTRNFCS